MDNINHFNTFIVDDDLFCSTLLFQHLSLQGFTRLKVFNNGQACINHLTDEPQLIFLDYNMDNMDGLQVLKKIKRFNPDIFIIIVSAQKDLQVAVNALKYGAFDYIIKGNGDLERMSMILEKLNNVVKVMKQQSIVKKFSLQQLLRKTRMISRMYLFMVSIMVSVFFSSCATQNMFSSPKKIVPDTIGLAAQNFQYTLEKNDKVSISVWGHDDLSVGSLYGIYNSNEVYGKWLMIDAKGEVPVPKIGNIQVSGLTLLQAEQKIAQALAKWIVEPIVEIKVLNKEVTVLGELKSPGKFLLEKQENTLLEVIGRAGDFDFYADKKRIQVIRKINGSIKTYSINLTAVDSYSLANMNIEPGDVVYVPSRKGKHWDKRAGSTIVPIASVISSVVLVAGLLTK